MPGRHEEIHLQRRGRGLRGLNHLLEVAQVMNERAEVQTQVISVAKALAASSTGKASSRHLADISCLFKDTIRDLCLKNPAQATEDFKDQSWYFRRLWADTRHERNRGDRNPALKSQDRFPGRKGFLLQKFPPACDPASRDGVSPSCILLSPLEMIISSPHPHLFCSAGCPGGHMPVLPPGPCAS